MPELTPQAQYLSALYHLGRKNITFPKFLEICVPLVDLEHSEFRSSLNISREDILAWKNGTQAYTPKQQSAVARWFGRRLSPSPRQRAQQENQAKRAKDRAEHPKKINSQRLSIRMTPLQIQALTARAAAKGLALEKWAHDTLLTTP